MKSLILVFGVLFSLQGFSQDKSAQQNAGDDDAAYLTCMSKCPQNTTKSADGISQGADPTCAARCSQKFPVGGGSCDTAYKAYTDSKKDNPCNSYGGSGTSLNKCLELVNKCSGQLNSIAGVNGEEADVSNMTQVLSEILTGVNAQSAQKTPQPIMSSDDCFKLSNKSIKDAKKEYEKSVKEIEKEIADVKKKINEDNEKLRKEQSRLQKEETDIKNDSAKEIQKIEVSKREKLTKISQEIQENGINIRKLNTQISKEKIAAEKIKFDHINSMKQFDKNKVKSACTAALDTAKSCIQRARKGEKFASSDTCANFQLVGKGAAGTKALQQKIKDINSACYETYETQINTANFNYSNSLRDSDMKIKDLNDQISDANTALAAKQKETTDVTGELDKEKSQAESALSEKINNYAKELQNLTQSTNESVATSNEELTKLQQKLAELKVVQYSNNMGITNTGTDVLDSVVNETSEKIGAINGAATAAATACNCPTTAQGTLDTSKGVKPQCREIGTYLYGDGSAMKTKAKKEKTTAGQKK